MKISFISQDMPQDAVELTVRELRGFLESKYTDFIYIESSASKEITDLNTGSTFLCFRKNSVHITNRVGELMDYIDEFAFKYDVKEVCVHEYKSRKEAIKVINIYMEES